MFYPLDTWIITSPYGDRIHPILNVLKFHNGIDLKAPVGTPLKAPADSTVEKKYSNATGGNQVILIHPNGYKTGYAHLQDIYVEVGDKFKAGDIFATTGNTGASTGAHLHFTVRKDNKIIDPETVSFKSFDSKKKTLLALSMIVTVITAYFLFLKKY